MFEVSYLIGLFLIAVVVTLAGLHIRKMSKIRDEACKEYIERTRTKPLPTPTNPLPDFKHEAKVKNPTTITTKVESVKAQVVDHTYKNTNQSYSRSSGSISRSSPSRSAGHTHISNGNDMLAMHHATNSWGGYDTGSGSSYSASYSSCSSSSSSSDSSSSDSGSSCSGSSD